jgi:hypothetical protein
MYYVNSIVLIVSSFNCIQEKNVERQKKVGDGGSSLHDFLPCGLEVCHYHQKLPQPPLLPFSAFQLDKVKENDN